MRKTKKKNKGTAATIESTDTGRAADRPGEGAGSPAAAGEPREGRRARAVFVAFLLLLAAVSGFEAWRIHDRTRPLGEGKTNYLIEDAGISVVFAKNIAAGEGIVYYPDGERVEGYSNPLWTFTLVALIKAGVDPWAIPRPMGIAATGAALFFAGLLVWFALSGPMRFLGLLAPVFAGEQGVTVIWAVAGLENGLFAATVLAALALFARERRNPRALPISGFVFFLAAITRPEGAMYGGMAGLFVLLTEVLPRRRLTWRQVAFGASFLAPLGAFWAWRLWYFSWPQPMPFYGKVTPETMADLKNWNGGGWRYLRDFVKTYEFKPVLILAALAPFSRRDWRPAALCLPALGFALFFPVYAHGDWMWEWRFCSLIAAVAAPFAILGAARVAGIAGWIARRLTRDRAATVVTAAGFALAAFLVIFVYRPTLAPGNARLVKWVAKPQVNTFGLARRGEYYRDMGDRLDLRPGSVADTDMGGIGEKSGMEIVDVGRLCDVPFAINRWSKPFVDQYVFNERRPDIIHARKAWGHASHLSDNPFLRRDYVRLPEVRKLGTDGPNGNFIRKDLFVKDRYRVDPARVRPVEGAGISLVDAGFVTPVAEPRQQLRVTAVWRTDGAAEPKLKAEYALVRDDGSFLTSKTDRLVMDWYPTQSWQPGEFPVDRVRIRIPKTAAPGTYRLVVRVLGSDNAPRGVIDTDATIRISRDAVDARIDELRDGVTKAIADDPMAALPLIDEWLYYRSTFDEQAAIKQARVRVALALAHRARAALEAGDEAGAAALAVAGRRLEHRPAAVQSICRELALLAYKRGLDMEAKGGDANLDAAYHEFSEALRRYPPLSKARRHAEQTRPTGVLRVGDDRDPQNRGPKSSRF